jgi:hypothetical protein
MKTTKMLKVGVLALATLTILAGCSGSKNDNVAQETVQKSLVNSTKVKSENYDLLLKGKVTAGKDSKAKFKEIAGSLGFSGVFDMKVQTDPKFTLKVDVKGAIDGGKEQLLNGEMRLANKNMYFSVAKVESEMIPEAYKLAATMFLNKWWSLELPPESFASLTAGAVDDKDLTPEQKQIRTLMENARFFKNVKNLGADKVGDVAVENYSVELDTEALSKYLKDVAKITNATTADAEAAQIDKMTALLKFKGNVWVSKDDMMMRKVDGMATIAAGEASNNLDLNFQFTYTVENLNKDAKIEVPAKAEKFDLSKILGLPAAPAVPAVPAKK